MKVAIKQLRGPRAEGGGSHWLKHCASPARRWIQAWRLHRVLLIVLTPDKLSPARMFFFPLPEPSILTLVLMLSKQLWI
eukprot:1161932-Pelagomonas_calceolata.AAC.3